MINQYMNTNEKQEFVNSFTQALTDHYTPHRRDNDSAIYLKEIVDHYKISPWIDALIYGIYDTDVHRELGRVYVRRSSREISNIVIHSQFWALFDMDANTIIQPFIQTQCFDPEEY